MSVLNVYDVMHTVTVVSSFVVFGEHFYLFLLIFVVFVVSVT
jgi:hypothetical protein